LKKDTKSLIFLPAYETYTSIYNKYINSVAETSGASVSFTTFWRIWDVYLPDIKFLTPRSDLCDFCKECRFNANNWTEKEKEDKIVKWNNHIMWAKKEREYYRY